MPERHAAHAALAEALAGQPERRVWHRAASVVGADEAVAGELEAAARVAQRRGAHPVALNALERAAELSGDPVRRGARLLGAAELASDMGRPDVVVRTLRAAEPLELGPGERTRIAWLRELYATELWSGTARTSALVELADRMRAEGDPERALKWLRHIAFRCYWSYPDQAADALVLDAVDADALPAGPPGGARGARTRGPGGLRAGDHRAAGAQAPGRRPRGALPSHARLDLRRGLRPLGRADRRGRRRPARPGPARPAGPGAGLAGVGGVPSRQLGRSGWPRRRRRSGSRARPGSRGGRSRARWPRRRCAPCAARAASSRRPKPPRPSCCRWARARCSCSCRSRAAWPRSAMAATATPTTRWHASSIPATSPTTGSSAGGCWSTSSTAPSTAAITTRRARSIAAIEGDAARSGSPMLSMALHYARPVLAGGDDAEALFARGHRERRRRDLAADPRAAAARLRRLAAAPAPARGLARAAAGGARGLRRARRRALGRARAPGAARVG